MTGVSQQGDGIAQYSVDRLDDHEPEVESHADREGPAETRRRVAMCASMPMIVIVVATVLELVMMASNAFMGDCSFASPLPDAGLGESKRQARKMSL